MATKPQNRDSDTPESTPGFREGNRESDRRSTHVQCARLRAELALCEQRIAAAYWRFTRCARALPPVLAEPVAYARRRELRRLLGSRS